MDDIVGLVPAAGEGTRLYPFSRAVPKEMYPIMGKTVIEHCIENLKEGGIKKVFVVVGHQKGALMDYLGDGRYFGVNAAYIYQYERKGLGHAILQGKKWISSPFVVLLGDSFIEPKVEINDLISLHKKEKPIATLLLFKVDDPTGYGIVKLGDSGEVEDLIEKPSAEAAAAFKKNGSFLAITGAYVFEPEIFSYIERTPPGLKGEVQITDAIALAAKDGKKVLGLELKGRYLDIGKWKTVLSVEKEMAGKANVEERVSDREGLREKSNCD